MNDEELAVCWRVAAGAFPKAFEPGSESVRTIWSTALRAFEADDVCRAFAELAQDRPDFPEHSTLIARTREVMAQRLETEARLDLEQRPRLEAPAPTKRWAVGQFDRAATDDRTARHAELAAFARRFPMDDLDRRHASIESTGPWEAKARTLLNRGFASGQASMAMVQTMLERL